MKKVFFRGTVVLFLLFALVCAGSISFAADNSNTNQKDKTVVEKVIEKIDKKLDEIKHKIEKRFEPPRNGPGAGAVRG